MIDSTGEPMHVVRAPWLDIDLPEVERFEALLFPAVEQALGCVEAARDPAIEIALALGLPAARPGLPADLERALRARIAGWFKTRFSAVAVFDVAPRAGLVGMLAVMTHMDTGTIDACVVAGVESYLAPESLSGWKRTDSSMVRAR